MNRITIHRFDVIRTANVVAVLYALIVLVIGLLFLLPVTLLGALGSRSYGGASVAAGIGGLVVLLVFGTVAYAILGWVTAAIGCALYNLVAARIGGIRVDVIGEVPYQPQLAYPGGWGQPAMIGQAPGPVQAALWTPPDAQADGPPPPPQGSGRA